MFYLYKMSSHTRNGFKWSVNEVLSLQREFELLGWSIDEIAQKHKRTPNAIMFKLDQEGFANYNVLYSDYHDLNNQMSNENAFELSLEYNNNNNEDNESQTDHDSKDDVYNLSQRVDGLEENILDIRNIIKQMMSTFSKSSASSSKSWF